MKKGECHIVKKPNKLIWRAKIIAKFPHIWVCAIILFAAVASLLVSLSLNCSGNNFWASIFSNVFAGLITGFVVCLISGMKQLTTTKAREKKAWLENLSGMLKRYFSGYNQLVKMRFDRFNGDEETFNFIYDVGSYANWVNDEIIQSSFSKTLPFNSLKYSKDYLSYDALGLCDAFERLHGNLQMLDVDRPSAKEIVKYFEEVNPALRGLNSEVYTAIRNIEIQLSEIGKTVV